MTVKTNNNSVEDKIMGRKAVKETPSKEEIDYFSIKTVWSCEKDGNKALYNGFQIANMVNNDEKDRIKSGITSLTTKNKYNIKLEK